MRALFCFLIAAVRLLTSGFVAAEQTSGMQIGRNTSVYNLKDQKGKEVPQDRCQKQQRLPPSGIDSDENEYQKKCF